MLKHLAASITITLLLVTQVQADEKTYSLIDIYQQALAHDPTLASALSANKAAQEIIEQGKALYRPTVTFNADANKYSTDIRYIGRNLPPSSSNYETYKYGVDVRQPIYRKQNLVQMDQTLIQVSQADKQLHQTKQQLILRVTQAYFDVLIAQDKIDLIASQKLAILSQLEQAKANFEVGTATITDVNESQARYDLVVAQEIANFNELQVAKRAIQALTGKIPERLATVKADIKTSQLEQPMDKWLEVAVINNLNVQIQKDAARFAEQEVQRLNAAHLPTLDAVASYTDSYANGSPSAFGSGNELETATIGLQLQIPIYQGGAISSRVRQAVLNYQKAQEDVEVARTTAELETQRSYLNLSTSIAQAKAYEQALVSSQSQVDSTKLGYEVGVRTSVDVLNAEQQYFLAKRDLLQSRYNYLMSIIRLKAASGIVAEADLEDINRQLVLAAGNQ